jgi:hypothetical protein
MLEAFFVCTILGLLPPVYYQVKLNTPHKVTIFNYQIGPVRSFIISWVMTTIVIAGAFLILE